MSVCFHDRFYTIDEIAVLIKAVKSNQHEFSILQYDGEKYCIVQQRSWLSWESWPRCSTGNSQESIL